MRLPVLCLCVAAAPCASASNRGASGADAGYIDATVTLDQSTTPVYEGDAPMRFEFLQEIRRGAPLTLSAYSLGAHSGTHVDAPMHFVAGGAPIDKVPLDRLIGAARGIGIADDVPGA